MSLNASPLSFTPVVVKRRRPLTSAPAVLFLFSSFLPPSAVAHHMEMFGKNVKAFDDATAVGFRTP